LVTIIFPDFSGRKYDPQVFTSYHSFVVFAHEASELFASYPCRLHLTSSPNTTTPFSQNKFNDGRNKAKALSCYVLGYGGGLISGDSINLDIHVKPNAALMITSQSTSKAFKAVAGREPTRVETRATVGRRALLFLVPQPVQCFTASNLVQQTKVILDGNITDSVDDPSLVLVDWYTGGRRHEDGGVWQLDAFHTTTTVHYSINNTLQFQPEMDLDKIFIESSSTLVFRDATKLSGGKELVRHMRNFNIVCMVLLIGPRTEKIASKLLSQYSSRNSYRDSDKDNDMHVQNSYNSGVGLNGAKEGLLLSCGAFYSKANGRLRKGTVLRIAASTLEIAATFLSRNIGDMEELESDPFMEILISKQGNHFHCTKDDISKTADAGATNNDHSSKFDLLRKSFKNPIKIPDRFPLNGIEPTRVNPIILFQMVDSCVPSGGFAHSNTLETAHQLHLILRDNLSSWTRALREHIWDVIIQTCTSTIPFLVGSCTLFHSVTIDNAHLLKELLHKWELLDYGLRCNMSSHVASRASSTQGSGILRAFSSAFPHIAPAIKLLKKRILLLDQELSDFSGHAATCFGAVCGMLNIDNETCSSMFLYTTARDMVNAAVRMNLIGPLEGMQVTNELCTSIMELVKTQLIPSLNDGSLDTLSSHQVCPLVEVLANAHDRLYTRLFNS
jgi:urease accessory protein